jgi:diadenosine tetraphosphatase ApaH/serine/threonine PP2A family protein phosphatase
LNFECFDTWIGFIGHSHQPFVVEMLLLEGEDDAELTDDTPKHFGQHKLLCPDPTLIELTDDKRYLINVGSIGQPRDRDPRACYVIVDVDARSLEFRRVDYDIEAAQSAIIENDLPVDLADRLSAGW